MGQNAQFMSVTFVGMMLGSFLTGFLGDRYGRRFTYQANLAIFGLASIASAFAPSMVALTLLRFIMGVGLGAENVVGYSTMTEFVPPQARGKWLGGMNVIVVSGLPVAALLGTLIIPKAKSRESTLHFLLPCREHPRMLLPISVRCSARRCFLA
jgi:putative MFS transporter